MKQTIKIIFLLTVLFCFFYLTGFCFAQEITYPEIPGAETPTEGTQLPEYIKYIFNFAIAIGGILAFAVLVFGGIRWLTSAGSPSAISDAKSRILAGIIGLVLLLCSYLIFTTINPELAILKLPDLTSFKPTKPPEYIPPETETTYYQEIPIGFLIENILAKNISCFDEKNNLIDCHNGNRIQDAVEDKFSSKTHFNYCYQYDDDGNKKELLKNHDRLDCIKKISEAIEIKSEILKNKSIALKKAIEQCQCLNCEKGYCKNGSCDGQCHCNPCVSYCHCCGAPRDEQQSCSGNTPYGIGNDPCPNRIQIDNLRNDIYQLINGTEKKLKGANLVNNPSHDPKILSLKEARPRLIGLKNELIQDLNYLKEAEKLAKYPYGQKISLAEYQEKKKTEKKIDETEFKNLDIAIYCRVFNCVKEINEICIEYDLNVNGTLCNALSDPHGEPCTFYFPEKEYE